MESRINVENKIKMISDVSWLFPSQKIVYSDICNILGSIYRVINIYGFQGVGKTFLAHVLHKEKKVEYISSPEQLKSSDLPMVVDNAYFERTAVRGIRNQMRKYSLNHIIIITRYRVEDTIPSIELKITSDDIAHFRSNIFRYLDLRLPNCSELNLWEHLKLIGGNYG